MNCEESKKLLPGLALDELDVEERREVERHAAECAACRSERDALARTLGRLKALPEAETSAARRDDVVAAMAAARNEVIDRALLRPRRPAGFLWAAAAAALMGVVGWAAWSPFITGPVYRIAAATKGGIIRDNGTSGLKEGDAIWRGDGVFAADEAVRLESADVALVLAPRSTLKIQAGQLLLERGWVAIEVKRGEVVVVDLDGDRATLRVGRFDLEAQLRLGVVAGRNGEQKEASAIRLQAKVVSGSARLAGVKGEVELGAGERGELDVLGYATRKRD